MTGLSFVMDGVPVGKGRPRFSRKTGHVYTPEKTARYEERLAWAAQCEMKGRPLFEGPLEVRLTALMPVPASKPVKWKAAALGGLHRPTGKPDADNVAKVLDALNGVVWRDDAQIVELHVSKTYGDKPGLCVWVKSLA